MTDTLKINKINDQVFDLMNEKTKTLDLNKIDPNMEQPEADWSKVDIAGHISKKLDEGWRSGEIYTDNYRKLYVDLLQEHKHDVFGEEYYSRPFDEDTEASILKGDKSREKLEFTRFRSDIAEATKQRDITTFPEVTSKEYDIPRIRKYEEIKYTWFGEKEYMEDFTEEFAPMVDGKRQWKRTSPDEETGFKNTFQGLEAKKMQRSYNEEIDSSDLSFNDLYFLLKDKYSSFEEWEKDAEKKGVNPYDFESNRY